MINGTLWFIMAAIVVIIAIIIVVTRRFSGLADTNDRIEENQRRGLELAEIQEERQKRLEDHSARQTAALERIANALETR